jgi:HNH endonuclease
VTPLVGDATASCLLKHSRPPTGMFTSPTGLAARGRVTSASDSLDRATWLQSSLIEAVETGMGPLVAEPEMAARDIVGEVLRSVLAEVLSTPWLVGLLVVLAIGKLVQLGRAVVHSGHGRDPRRAFSWAEKALLLERAGHRCERHSWLLGRCRETEALQADHVHPHSCGGATDVANGQALCKRHNRRKAARVPWSGTGGLTSHRVPLRPSSAMDRTAARRVRGSRPARCRGRVCCSTCPPTRIESRAWYHLGTIMAWR